MDHERGAGGDWHPPRRSSQACARHRREAGDLSRLSVFERLHLSLRPHLDQRDGATAGLKWENGIGKAISIANLYFARTLELFPNHFHQHPLGPISIKLAVKNLLPRAKIQF